MATINKSLIEKLILDGSVDNFVTTDLSIGYQQVEMFFIDINKNEMFKYLDDSYSKTISFIGKCNDFQSFIH